MPICPHCETKGSELHAACPGGDGFFLINEDDYHGHVNDRWLGRRLGDRFIISSILGQGSMGFVYKAYQAQVDRFVAIKVFNTAKMRYEYEPTGPEERERFVQEARVLAKLSHPNCVTLYDFGYDDDEQFLYIAMEHVKGISLRRAVRRGLKFEAVSEVVRQVLMALREAHALGIVHRDLKPENIILSYRATSDEQIVKVLDFGIAKLLRQDPGKRTAAGLLFGTPAYMSPEQCRGEPDVTPATDIYALGCMIFEMVTGHLPFEANRPREMVRMHQQDPVPAIVPRLGSSLPEGVEEFIRTCMAKEADQRFAHAGQALQRFEEIVGGSANRGRLASGLAHLSDDKGAFRVSVPKNRISGVHLDPTREIKRDEILAEAQKYKKGEHRTEHSLLGPGVTDTIRPGGDAKKQKKKRRAVKSSGGLLAGRQGLVAAAVLTVLIFIALLVVFIYVTLGG